MGFEVTAKHSNGRTPIHFDDFFFFKGKSQAAKYKTLSFSFFG